MKLIVVIHFGKKSLLLFVLLLIVAMIIVKFCDVTRINNFNSLGILLTILLIVCNFEHVLLYVLFLV